MRRFVKLLPALAVLVIAMLFSARPAMAEGEVARNTRTGARYSDLQTAVNAAAAGDEIQMIADAHLTSAQLVINKAITFTTDGNGDHTIYVEFNEPASSTNSKKWGVYLSSANVTFGGTEGSRIIIDGGSVWRTRGLLYVSTGKGAHVSYVTVQNGWNNGDKNNNCCGGIYVSNGTATFGETVIENCIITDCRADSAESGSVGSGGGMVVNSKNIWIKNCRFLNNFATGYGGGISQPSQSNTANYSGCVIEDCYFENNTAPSGHGANAYIGLSVGTIRNCTFADGSATLVCNGTQSGNLFTGDMDYETPGDNAAQLSALPTFTGGTFLAYADGDDLTAEAIYSATADSYENYVAAASDSLGCTFSRRTIDGLRIANAVTGGKRYIIYYRDFDRIMQIVAEPADYSDFGSFDHTPGYVLPTVTMMNVDDNSVTDAVGSDDTVYGLCLIYRLSDGSFIIVDGGYNDGAYSDTTRATTRLYNKLVELSGGKTSGIKIAAWFVTHSHNDHSACLISFNRRYGSLVTLERLILNLPPDYEYEAPHGDTGTNIVWKTYLKDEVFLWAQKVIKAHAGDHYEIGDAKIDVLYTLELAKPIRVSNINESSVVFKVSLGDRTTMVTGDASKFTQQVMLGCYGSTMKADIVTVNHHGSPSNGVTAPWYQAISPSIVLWPASFKCYNFSSYLNNPANVWLHNNVAAENIYVAKDYVAADGWCVTLPLTEYNASLSMALTVDSELSASFTAGVSDPNGLFRDIWLRVRFEGDEDSRLLSASAVNGSEYTFIYDHIGAQRMGEVITAELIGVCASGNRVISRITAQDGWSIAKYCDAVRAARPSEAATITLMASLLKMGQAAQAYSGWRTDSLAGAGYAWVDTCTNTDVPTAADNAKTRGPSGGEARIASVGLIIENRVGLYLRVTAQDRSGLTLEVAAPQVGVNAVYDLSSPGGAVSYREKGIYIRLDRISPWNYGAVFTFTLRKAGAAIQTATYSVDSYCFEQAADPAAGPLALAIYRLGRAASDYRG